MASLLALTRFALSRICSAASCKRLGCQPTKRIGCVPGAGEQLPTPRCLFNDDVGSCRQIMRSTKRVRLEAKYLTHRFCFTRVISVVQFVESKDTALDQPILDCLKRQLCRAIKGQVKECQSDNRFRPSLEISGSGFGGIARHQFEFL